jgi:hypothetical protein
VEEAWQGAPACTAQRPAAKPAPPPAAAPTQVALLARKFVGNSVSTFSALAIHQRRHAGRWASYYNGGNIPVAEFVPMDLLPWVFSHSDGQGAEADDLVRSAVRSAVRYRSLRPYCLWSGGPAAASPMRRWLRAQGVVVIPHRPAWADDLWALAEPRMEANLRRTGSRLFTNRTALLADFARMDLPILPQLEQYVYALYTHTDVFFPRRLGLSTFPLPLPDPVGMAADAEAPWGLDGGVSMLNLPSLRQEYADLRRFVLSSRGGGDYPGYAPGMAGAYLQFYEQAATSMYLSPLFGAKPWQDFAALAQVVHFQGPKPADYMRYYHTLECPGQYKDRCALGFKKALCPYAKKLDGLLQYEEHEDNYPLRLYYACTAMYAPHLSGVVRPPGEARPAGGSAGGAGVGLAMAVGVEGGGGGSQARVGRGHRMSHRGDAALAVGGASQ